MNPLLWIIVLTLINHGRGQDSVTASIDVQNPFVGDTIRMSCTLVRQQRFSREIVSYIVNDAFAIESSVINSNSGTVGGIAVSRMQASTAASEDNRVTLMGQIILSNVQVSDAVGGSIRLGCVGLFGSNSANVNVSALASVPRAVIPDSATATINNDKPYVGDTLEVNCVLSRQQGFTENTVRYIVNDAFSIFASVLNGNSGVIGGIDLSRLQASTLSSADGGVTLTGRIILSNVQLSDAVNGNIRLGCVGVFGSNPGDNLNTSAITDAPYSGGSRIPITSSIIIVSSILLSIFWL